MLTRVSIVIGCLLVASFAVARADRPEQTPLRMPFSVFPMEMGNWSGIQLPPFSEQVLAVLGLDDYVTRNYVRPDRALANLYIGYWQSQKQGDTMHSPQNCLPGAGWVPVSQSLLTFADPRRPEAPPLTVNRYVIGKGLERQLVLYWYQGRGRVVGSEYMSKIYLVLDAARYNRTDSALVRVIVPVSGTSSDAETTAESNAVDFSKQLMLELGRFLPE